MADYRRKLPRRDFIVKSAGGAAAAAVGAGALPGALSRVFAAGSPSRPPNIIIILTDDQGRGDLGCYGAEAIKTPNIDGMAAEGVKMTDFFTSAPVCSPSRAGLLTGRYPPRTKINAVLFPSDTPMGMAWRAFMNLPLGLPPDEITVAEALKRKNYATCCIGKWHLGDRPRFRPHRRGFDYFYGVLYSNDMDPFEVYRNDEVVYEHPADQARLTGDYTKEAVNFIERSRHGPFFLYLAHTFPHIPLHASDRFRGKSRAGLYGDAIEEIDWSTGEILGALKRHGIEDDTYVFFTSDNGPWYQGSAAGSRGRKGETLDGGMRVPFIAKGPGIPEGRVIGEPAMNIDLFTTSLAIAGVPIPDDRVIDGRNLLPLLRGKSLETPHEALFFYRRGELQAVRVGKWKYYRERRLWMYPPGKKGPWLINTEEDPYESYDAALHYPQKAMELKKLMDEWEKNFDRGFKTK